MDKRKQSARHGALLFNVEPYQEQTADGSYGMGCCATIPEGVEIPEHLYEMGLPGGDYVVSVWKDTDGPYDKIWELLRDKDWKSISENRAAV